MTSRQYQSAREEHPFAPYVRILGKGRSGSRALDREEARTAFGMILRGETEDLQLGAFLMLLRVKEETGAELAGFVDACREEMSQPPEGLSADLDWSSYAGKKHQHPWYLLSMVLLSSAGYRVFVHGCDGHTPGRLYTEQALLQLNLPVAGDWNEAGSQLREHGLSYLPLRHWCLPLHELMQLRPLLGLRSPVNTLARMLNPLRAPCSLQSVFHPAYSRLHQEADALLGQPRAAVFRGDSGEVEIKPQADTRLHMLADGESRELSLPRTLSQRVAAVEAPAVEPLRALWRGDGEDPFGLETTLATAAAALLLLEPGLNTAGARDRAARLWEQRDTGRLV